MVLLLIFTDSYFVLYGNSDMKKLYLVANGNDHSTRYDKKLLDAKREQVTITHRIHESDSLFVLQNEQCHNCLPNYFIHANKTDPSNYRRGIVGFLHHLKAGGTTVHNCIWKLVSTSYSWNGKTERRHPNQVFIVNFDYHRRALWKKKSIEARLQFKFLGGIAAMGVCEDFQDSETQPSCSYFTMLREPIDRIVSSYFYCKVRPTDILCATKQLDASQANIVQWALHQRSFLFTQLTIDYRYCNRFPQTMRRTAPCWYRQRALEEQTDLGLILQFILEDLTNRFAVIGIFDHFQESLSMFEKVRVKKYFFSIFHCT
jgi:hypothetical protein